MINYLNIYNQIQTLDNLKSIMIDVYMYWIIKTIIIVIFITTLCAIGIYAMLKATDNDRRAKNFSLCLTIILSIVYILFIRFIYIAELKPAFHNIVTLKTNSADVIKLYKDSNIKYKASEYKIDDLLNFTELQDILTVKGVTNIDAFNTNVSYLKETYRKKVNTFKATYDKKVTISEHEYINSILNQFYLGKISDTPADMTDFEEDYPRVSINLKK